MKITQQLMARFNEYWVTLRAREKMFLGTGAVFLAGVAIYFIIIEPALSAHHRLDRKLPILRAELAQMQALAKEAGQIANPLSPVTNASAMIDNLRAGLAQARLVVDPAKIRTDAHEHISLTLEDADFDTFLLWLADTQARLGLRTISARIDKTDTPGQARIDLTLELPGKAAKAR